MYCIVAACQSGKHFNSICMHNCYAPGHCKETTDILAYANIKKDLKQCANPGHVCIRNYEARMQIACFVLPI